MNPDPLAARRSLDTTADTQQRRKAVPLLVIQRWRIRQNLGDVFLQPQSLEVAPGFDDGGIIRRTVGPRRKAGDTGAF